MNGINSKFSLGENELKHAQHIWSMLDDMADKDPEAYQKFVQSQMNEAKEYQNSQKNSQRPQPGACLEIECRKNGSKYKIKNSDQSVYIERCFINICHSERVEKTSVDVFQLPEDATIPVVILEESVIQEEGRWNLVVDTVFHPTILQRCVKDRRFKSNIASLSIHCVENTLKISLKPETMLVKEGMYKEPPGTRSKSPNHTEKGRNPEIIIPKDEVMDDTIQEGISESTIKIPSAKIPQSSKILIEEVNPKNINSGIEYSEKGKDTKSPVNTNKITPTYIMEWSDAKLLIQIDLLSCEPIKETTLSPECKVWQDQFYFEYGKAQLLIPIDPPSTNCSQKTEMELDLSQAKGVLKKKSSQFQISIPRKPKKL